MLARIVHLRPNRLRDQSFRANGQCYAKQLGCAAMLLQKSSNKDTDYSPSEAASLPRPHGSQLNLTQSTFAKASGIADTGRQRLSLSKISMRS